METVGLKWRRPRFLFLGFPPKIRRSAQLQLQEKFWIDGKRDASSSYANHLKQVTSRRHGTPTSYMKWVDDSRSQDTSSIPPLHTRRKCISWGINRLPKPLFRNDLRIRTCRTRSTRPGHVGIPIAVVPVMLNGTFCSTGPALPSRYAQCYVLPVSHEIAECPKYSCIRSA